MLGDFVLGVSDYIWVGAISIWGRLEFINTEYIVTKIYTTIITAHAGGLKGIIYTKGLWITIKKEGIKVGLFLF